MPSHALPDNQGKRYQLVTPALLLFSCLGSWLLAAPMTMAQVTPDGSLSTTVNTSGNNFTIENGDRMGNNLFHSFQEFSVPTNGSAFFNNAADIQNIFSRVTGRKISNIDGLLRANGGANLFLLNPNGIVFGPNASLNIGGSFFGSTAQSIRFADGVEFSATNPTASPLLTIAVPIGLQVGSNPGSITVRGSGHNIITDPQTLDYDKTARPPGLQVPAGQTLALVGGDITLEGGNLTAENGRVETWAVRNTDVSLALSPSLQLSHPDTEAIDWGTIVLRQSSSIDASGESGGAIQIRGRGLTLQDASFVFVETQGIGKGNGITVQTSEFVDLLGASAPNPLFIPGLGSFARGGNGSISGDITVQTGRLRLANGDTISATPFGDGASSGNILVRAADVEVHGSLPFAPFFSSTIANIVASPNGNAGNIIIDAERVRILDGSYIAADVLVGSGNGGDVVIRASESITVQGMRVDGVVTALSSAIQPGTRGNGGNLVLETGQLVVADGGQISTAVAGEGNAGNIQIQATEVLVSDAVLDSFSGNLSGITAAVKTGSTGNGGNINIEANRLHVFDGGQIASTNDGNGIAGNITLRVQDLNVEGFGALRAISFNTLEPLPENGRLTPSAITATSSTDRTAGSVNITANTLRVSNNAGILVSNTGGGNAGNLNITAHNILLNNRGSLQAEVNGGSQGNINLTVRDSLVLRQGSTITTNATGASTGGNITIDSPTIVGLENSDIVANAVQGRGGNIQINTQGIFGLQNRPQLTRESDITASSQFGLSGTINVSVLNVNQQNVVAPPPSNFVSTDQVVANRCLSRQGNSQGTFTLAGNGGLPETPETTTIPYEVVQVRAAQTPQATPRQQESKPTPTATPSWKPGDPIIEATEFRINAQGQVELTANQNTARTYSQPIPCQPN